MFRLTRNFLLLFLFLSIFDSVKSQTAPPPVSVEPVNGNGRGSGSGSGRGSGIGGGFGYGVDNEDNDDTKITGATVRGKVIYEDTGRPLRYALIALAADNLPAGYSNYAARYVKTDGNGEFVMKNVKPGTYLPYIKSDGILTPDNFRLSFNPEEKTVLPAELFEKLTVAGIGEIQMTVRARRGAAISGHIVYADGETAVGVKIDVLRKVGDRYNIISAGFGITTGNTKTDDRGAFRIYGLPEGTYLIRASEPVSNSQGSYENAYASYNISSLLKTYYPNGETIKNAGEITLAAGQEQTSIDITLPQRQLFNISGMILAKKDRQPLENFNISFVKMSDPDNGIMEFSGGYLPVNSKKSGAFEITGLPKGKYRLTVSQKYTYRNPANAQAVKTPEYPTIVKDVEIAAQNLNNEVFEMPAASSLSGTLAISNGKDVPQNVRIYIVNTETNQIFTSEPEYAPSSKGAPPVKSREFRIGKISPGKYRLLVPDRSFYIVSADYNGHNAANAPVEIGEGEDADGLQIVLANDFGTIKGRVAGAETGKRIFISAFPNGVNYNELRFGTYNGLIKPDGTFEIKAKPGDYTLVILTQQNALSAVQDRQKYLEDLIKNGQPVSVKAGEIVNANLTFPK